MHVVCMHFSPQSGQPSDLVPNSTNSSCNLVAFWLNVTMASEAVAMQRQGKAYRLPCQAHDAHLPRPCQHAVQQDSQHPSMLAPVPHILLPLLWLVDVMAVNQALSHWILYCCRGLACIKAVDIVAVALHAIQLP